VPLLLSAVALRAEHSKERLQAATEVLNEIMATPDKSIPRDLLEKAHCAVIVPDLKKAAFIVGAKYGAGFVTCRRAGGWSAPASVKVEGGSVGFQIGGQNTDVVMLVMNQRGMKHLLEDKFTLGAEASVAAGPVGREAAAMTDAQMSADILSWSRNKGLFAGVALTGATLRADSDANRELYGSKLPNKEILNGSVTAPPEAEPLLSALTRYSPREEPNKPAESRAVDSADRPAKDKKK
jgi:SH3 domain-containing YSC84-like protein 1